MIVAVQLLHDNLSAQINFDENEVRQLPTQAMKAIKDTADSLAPDSSVVRITYDDDEGDACTLSEQTLEDALAFCVRSDGIGLLRLQVQMTKKEDVPITNVQDETPPDLPIHKGVECDGCGMYPILGSRHNKVGCDYDLCHSCFTKLSVEAQSNFREICRPASDGLKFVAHTLKVRFGWSDATLEAVKASPINELFESLKGKLSESEFTKFATAIEPAFAVQEPCVVPCLAELAIRLTNMLEFLKTAELLEIIPDSVSDIVSTLEKATSEDVPKHEREAEHVQVCVDRAPSDAGRGYAAVLSSLLQHSNEAVRAATRDMLAKAMLADCTSFPATESFIFLDDMVGYYECDAYSDAEKNDWHHVELVRHSGEAPQLTWSNRAGVSWTLTASCDCPPSLLVGTDCPYWPDGHHKCDVKLDDKGCVEGIFGPWGEFYRRVTDKEQADDHQDESFEKIPSESAATVVCSQLTLNNGSAMFEDVALRGDVTDEFAELLTQLPNVCQAYRIGCVAVPRGASGQSVVGKAYIKNIGTEAWPSDASLRIVAGPTHGLAHMPLGVASPGETVEIVLDLQMELADTGKAARSAWALCNSMGEPFGPLLLFETIYM
eukprot:TRINITY_DN33831_c0_g1_i1.p1 TRINITY_DN33831_c0_g1~~TRINITY_DN33831_c0_g1_i1.p1  ORF type:complete len:605 (+),score=81.38 TRINITY_DN33831_c0_g1_i1:99-1913(+)